MFIPRCAAIVRGALGLLAGSLLGGCPAALPEPPRRSELDTDAAASVAVEPDGKLDGAPAVLRLRIHLPQGVLESPEQAQLFAGTLSSYHLGRIRSGSLPLTLIERRIAAVSWAEAGGQELVLAPSEPLVPGETYSLASSRMGLIAAVTVATGDQAGLMARSWPPKDGGAGVERAIFCSDVGVPLENSLVELEPLGLAAEIGPAARPSLIGCMELFSRERPPDGAILVPPLRTGELALDPAPFVVTPVPRLVPQVCRPEETPLGPSCAQVEDDRLILRGLDVATFWMLDAAGLSVAAPLQPGRRIVVRGFVPESSVELQVTVLDVAGRASESRALITTQAVRSRVVVNEVLADAIGPEPAQEWVELVNDGSAAVDLDRWTLEDVGGTALLPAHRLEPGAFVLLVSAEFSEQSPWDLPPYPGTARLHLPALGKNGLANSGEALLLRSPDGTIVSRFPATPKPKPGVSVARTAPWALDEEASFALHAAPGASPGAANTLESPLAP